MTSSPGLSSVRRSKVNAVLAEGAESGVIEKEEHHILRRIIGWSFVLLALLCLLSGLMSTPVLSWLLP